MQQQKQAHALTLAHLRDRVPDVKDRTWAQRLKWLKAIKDAEALLAEPAVSIPLDPVYLAERFKSLNPLETGRTREELSRLRVRLVLAAQTTGLLRVGLRDERRLSPAWAQLRAEFPTPQYAAALGRLMRIANRRSIEPQQVSEAVIDELAKEAAQTSMSRASRHTGREAALWWNKLSALKPSLGLPKLAAPPHRRRLTRIKLDTLPNAAFAKDLAAYLSWASRSDPYDESTRRRALRPQSLSTVYCHVEAAVTALIRSGVDPKEIKSLASITRPQSLRGGLEWRDKTYGPTGYTDSLTKSIVQIARDWVKVDEATLSELEDLARRARVIPDALSARTRAVLRKLEEPLVYTNYMKLPEILFGESLQEDGPRALVKAQAAILLRQARMLPLMRRQFTEQKFGEHIVLRSDGHERSKILAAGHALGTSEGNADGINIPADLERMLVEFREVIAPKVIGRKPSYLFCTRTGARKNYASVRRLMLHYTNDRLGFPITPDVLRMLAAQVRLEENPEDHPLVSAALGHKSPQTSRERFLWLREREASKIHQQETERRLRRRRRPAGKGRPRRRR